MHTLATRVEEEIQRRDLIAPGSGLLVAVSGGVDSMVLLRVLSAWAKRHGSRLVVAHFNHQLRGAASDHDARFVERAARRLALECVVDSGNVPAVARERGWSVEMAARALRHEFLARSATRLQLRTVALAHHADDQVELFFLRLLRGAGAGLAGMKWRAPSPVDRSVMLVRPLLSQPKSELLVYARRERIRFREDASNDSTDILRNRIRRELLPRLRESFQPGLDRTVLRCMEIVGGESEFVQAAASRWLQRGRKTAFSKLSTAVQRQCVCQELAQLELAPDFELVERLRLEPNVRHSWRSGWLMRDTEGRVAFSAQAKAVPEHQSAGARIELNASSGAATFAGVTVKWRLRAGTTHPARSSAKDGERYDADRVGAAVVLRHWRRGDRFQPSGMAHPVKLQDLFTNAKVPVNERRQLLLAEAEDGRIFWVEGLRIAEQFKLTQATRKTLEWTWRRASFESKAEVRAGGSRARPETKTAPQT